MSLEKTYGVRYFEPGESVVARPGPRDVYYYELHLRREVVLLEHGDSAFVLRSDSDLVASMVRGPAEVKGSTFVVVIRGLMAESRSREIGPATLLPYVNGCSTKQIFPPDRAGDPTFQYLRIPANSAEQAHHIHSTARVVYVPEGRGISIVGMEKFVEHELIPGTAVILDPMCPHHFATPQGDDLVCLPVHVWSSTGVAEFNHPMFNGTHLMNQGD